MGELIRFTIFGLMCMISFFVMKKECSMTNRQAISQLVFSVCMYDLMNVYNSKSTIIADLLTFICGFIFKH